MVPSDTMSDDLTRRVEQHLLSGRRHCPDPSYLYFILGWNRAGEEE